MSTFYRSAPQYKNQISVVNGKKSGTDINLYKLFTEQCFNLLRPSGECGIVIPSGIYTDLGTKQLREMLFSQTKITGLFCFENLKMIFEGVDSRFKFVILTFEKSGTTQAFPTAFMRHDVKELKHFPNRDSLEVNVPLIRRLSPDSLSVMEFKNELDIQIAKKMLKFPLLGEKIDGTWNIKLTNEFHMTNDSHLFRQLPAPNRLPLYEGKMIHQFTNQWGQPKYWLDEAEAKEGLLNNRLRKIKKLFKENNITQDIDIDEFKLDYESYRLAFRDVARNTDERTMISTLLSPNVFCPHTMSLGQVFQDIIFDDSIQYNNRMTDHIQLTYLVAVFNSFIIDYLIRQKVTAHVSFFFVENLPIPRLTENDLYFNEIVTRAAKLICITPEFDDLALEIGLGSHHNGVSDPADRAKLRAELDGMIAHLYGLTEDEFSYILTTFPLVKDEIKKQALAAYHTYAPTTDDLAIKQLIQQGEGHHLEFKGSGRWNIAKSQYTKDLEKVIIKAIAGFLNADGGKLLIGVNDEGMILGLSNDYNTFNKKQNKDSYELWLRDLLLQKLGNNLSPLLTISFHLIENKEICCITAKPSPQRIFITEDSKKFFYLRSGNSTRTLSLSETISYCEKHWSKSPSAP